MNSLIKINQSILKKREEIKRLEECFFDELTQHIVISGQHSALSNNKVKFIFNFSFFNISQVSAYLSAYQVSTIRFSFLLSGHLNDDNIISSIKSNEFIISVHFSSYQDIELNEVKIKKIQEISRLEDFFFTQIIDYINSINKDEEDNMIFFSDGNNYISSQSKLKYCIINDFQEVIKNFVKDTNVQKHLNSSEPNLYAADIINNYYKIILKNTLNKNLPCNDFSKQNNKI